MQCEGKELSLYMFFCREIFHLCENKCHGSDERVWRFQSSQRRITICGLKKRHNVWWMILYCARNGGKRI